MRHPTARTTEQVDNAPIDTIRRFIDNYDDRCQPFTWTKDTDTILAKAQRSPKTKDDTLT
jgi:hypothetical protein